MAFSAGVGAVVGGITEVGKAHYKDLVMDLLMVLCGEVFLLEVHKF